MSSRLSTLKPMGSYRLSAATAVPPPASRWNTAGQCAAAIERHRAVRSVGACASRARPRPARPTRAALANLLNILGQRDGARSIIKVG